MSDADAALSSALVSLGLDPLFVRDRLAEEGGREALEAELAVRRRRRARERPPWPPAVETKAVSRV